MTLSLLTTGISLGISAATLIGPMQLIMMQIALAQGWRRSLVLAFAPLVADIPLILLMVFLLTRFPPELIQLMQIGGGLFLLYIAYNTYRSLRRGVSLADDGETGTVAVRTQFFRLVVINWLAPGAWIFWSTINGPLLVQGLNDSPVSGAAFLVGFYGTFCGLLAVFILLAAQLRRFDARFTQALLVVSIVIMTFFGLRLIGQGLGVIG